jgi:hypothetical protein
MKNITEHVGRLKLVRRLKNSHVGNPQFELAIIEHEPNLGWTFRTPKNSMIGYFIQNYLNKRVRVQIGTHYRCATLNRVELC